MVRKDAVHDVGSTDSGNLKAFFGYAAAFKNMPCSVNCRITGVGRIPKITLVDRAVCKICSAFGRNDVADYYEGINKTFFSYCFSCTERALASEAADAFDIIIGRDKFKGLGSCFCGIFAAGDAVGYFMHFGIVGCKIFVYIICPGVVKRNGKTADEESIAAFAAHSLCKVFGNLFCEFLVFNHLYIIVCAGLVRRFIGDYEDAFFTCAVKNCLNSGCIVRYYYDCVNAGVDKVFDDFNLLCGVCIGRTGYVCVYAEVFGCFLNAFFKYVEERNTEDFYYDSNFVFVVAFGCGVVSASGKANCEHCYAKQNCKDLFNSHKQCLLNRVCF